MALLNIEFNAPRLGKMTSVNVILPDGRNADSPRLPVLYLLHGYSDNHTAWQRRTALELYAMNHQMIIVMPDGQRSWYCNHDVQDNYEDFITQDLVEFIDVTLPTIADKAGRAIAGLSMGGYGSLMLAMKNPEIYCCASGHSGAYFFAHENIDEEFHKRLPYNHLDLGDKYDLFKISAQLPEEKRIPIRFDCGCDDFVLPCNHKLHAHLNEIGYEHEYTEFRGDHNWIYWNEHITKTLKFAAKNFGK